MLDFQRLRVYALAREFRCQAVGLVRALPRGSAGLADQLMRASLSVKLNIAEGAGEFAPREKARFYRIARRSADECGALIDDLVDLGLITNAEASGPLELIRRIVGALIRLIQSTESPKPTP